MPKAFGRSAFIEQLKVADAIRVICKGFTKEFMLKTAKTASIRIKSCIFANYMAIMA